MIADLTRAGEIDGAKRARTLLESLPVPTQIDTRIGTEISLGSLKPDGCTVEKTGDGIRLKPNRKHEAWVRIPREVPTPFRAVIVAKTDSTNIRLGYGRGRVILNWEANPNELQIGDPKTGKHRGFKGKGKLPVDTWHQIVWEIQENEMRLYSEWRSAAPTERRLRETQV